MHMECLILVNTVFWERDRALYYLVFWEFGFAVVLKVLTLYVGMRSWRSCSTCTNWIILKRRKTVYRTEPPIHISQVQQWFNRNTKHGLLLLPKLSLNGAMLIICIIVIRRATCHTILSQLQAILECKFQQPVCWTKSPKYVCTFTAGTQCQINKENTYIIRKNYMSEILHHLTLPCVFPFFVSLVGNWKGRRMLYLLLMRNTKKFLKIQLCLRSQFRTLNPWTSKFSQYCCHHRFHSNLWFWIGINFELCFMRIFWT